MSNEPPHILHIFSTFAPGGPQLRVIEYIRRSGGAFRHSIGAMNGDLSAAARLDGGPQVRLLQELKRRGRMLAPWHARGLVRELRPDLVVTYNWGAADALLGALSAGVRAIHTEDGFGPDEASGLKRRRVLARRLLLKGAWRTVVPSRVLERIALEQYGLPRSKVEWIPNGIDTERFRPGVDGGSVRSRFGIAAGDLVFGTVCHLRGEKNLGLMIRAFAAARVEGARLLIVGDGVKRAELEAAAGESGCAERMIFAGASADPLPFYGAMDVFLMSSITEQMPIVLIEAMSCGLPALCTDVGDSAAMLEAGGTPEIVPSGDVPAYAGSLRALGADAVLRARLGEKNRRLCAANYSLDRMVARYTELYRAACVRLLDCSGS